METLKSLLAEASYDFAKEPETKPTSNNINKQAIVNASQELIPMQRIGQSVTSALAQGNLNLAKAEHARMMAKYNTIFPVLQQILARIIERNS